MNKISSRILRGIRELGLALSLALSVIGWLSGLVATFLGGDPNNWQMVLFVFPLSFVVILWLCVIAYKLIEYWTVKKFEMIFDVDCRYPFKCFLSKAFHEYVYAEEVKKKMRRTAFKINGEYEILKQMDKESRDYKKKLKTMVEELINPFWRAHNLLYALGIVESKGSYKNYLP